ncbi:MAG: 4-hydroxythreonine-4-phosphate dehydrogenase PdxA [Puniceicoccaceae bacterium]
MPKTLCPDPETEPRPRRAPADPLPRPIAITGGDPAGIGPEIIEAWWERQTSDPGDYVFVGPPDWLTRLNQIRPARGIQIGRAGATPGRPNLESARTALGCLESVANGCLQGSFDGVVTGPVSKEWLARARFPHPGQTEFFAARWGGEPTMAFAGGRMRVALVTWHIPLAEVPKAIGRANLVRTIRHAAVLARATADLAEPRIGVCGLNPHAGENGVLGLEERDFINPILSELQAEFPGLSECLAADTLFLRHLEGEFDVVVALYHDQGLGPLKTIEFDSAVNVTLGLPYVRTSPDHGTAFALAGKREASSHSFSNAVDLARLLLAHRQDPGGPALDSPE